jgi:hypothetical protein
MRTLSKRVGWLIAGVVFAACNEEVSGPGEIEGSYELRLLNGEPLPYDHGGLGCCTYLSGELRLEDGAYDISVTARNRNTTQVSTFTEQGEYGRLGSGLAFTPEPIGSPFGLATGTVAPDSIRLSFGGEGPGSSDQFQAVFVRTP